VKLYKISQSRNTDWYTYDSAIVAANSKEEARTILPSPFYFYDDGFWFKYKSQEPGKEDTCPSWCDPKYVKAIEIGTSDETEPCVVLASYNAGFDESRYLDLRRMKVTVQHHPSPNKRAMAQHTIDSIQRQLKDRGLAELRYHLIEANRAHDLKKTQEYELKVRDYMNEEDMDWS
jgi:hypothetical protein